MGGSHDPKYSVVRTPSIYNLAEITPILDPEPHLNHWMNEWEKTARRLEKERLEAANKAIAAMNAEMANIGEHIEYYKSFAELRTAEQAAAAKKKAAELAERKKQKAREAAAARRAEQQARAAAEAHLTAAERRNLRMAEKNRVNAAEDRYVARTAQINLARKRAEAQLRRKKQELEKAKKQQAGPAAKKKNASPDDGFLYISSEDEDDMVGQGVRRGLSKKAKKKKKKGPLEVSEPRRPPTRLPTTQVGPLRVKATQAGLARKERQKAKKDKADSKVEAMRKKLSGLAKPKKVGPGKAALDAAAENRRRLKAGKPMMIANKSARPPQQATKAARLAALSKMNERYNASLPKKNAKLRREQLIKRGASMAKSKMADSVKKRLQAYKSKKRALATLATQASARRIARLAPPPRKAPATPPKSPPRRASTTPTTSPRRASTTPTTSPGAAARRIARLAPAPKKKAAATTSPGAAARRIARLAPPPPKKKAAAKKKKKGKSDGTGGVCKNKRSKNCAVKALPHAGTNRCPPSRRKKGCKAPN
jgi:hypothetical protein